MLETLENEINDLDDTTNPIHFSCGWSMWPEWWETTTESWREGFRARQKYEDCISRESDK